MQCVSSVISSLSAFFEFFPVSSSAHFVLLKEIFSVDVSHNVLLLQHLIPLVILLIYFSPLWWKALQDLKNALHKGAVKGNLRVVVLVCVSTLPLVVVGWMKYCDQWSDCIFGLPYLRSIGASFVCFGGLMLLADCYGKERRSWRDFTIFDACLLGALQTLSLITGASRLGLAMTAARFLGYQRASAFYLGVLTGVPVLFGAQVLHWSHIVDFYQKIDLWSVVMPLVLSVLGLAIAHWVMRGRGLFFIALYRMILGVILLVFF